jgi:cytochrome c5
VKKLLQKIWAQKKLGVAAVFLFLIVAISGIYTLIGIQKNVQKMSVNQEVTYFPDYPPVQNAGKSPEIIKRGEYLTKAGDCIACHTNTLEKGKAFSGGLPMNTPFGTIYSPNITPDKETGIGNWTEEQFIKAMREGIAPQGHYYYPAFPYLYFSKVSIEDLKAIKAYLDSIPAVHQKNLDNDMVWPFNIRFLQLGWRLLFFHPDKTTVYQPNLKRSAEWNRGAYLIEGLGHCAMCHSPSYRILGSDLPLGAPIKKYDLTGAKIQGYLAPNITGKNLATISINEIVEVFTKDHLIGGGKIEGPMLEVNRDSLSHLSLEDLTAMAVYLKSVESQTPPVSKAGGPGKALYETYCSGCHTTGAAGAPKYGDAADWEPVLKTGTENVYIKAIKGYQGMPAKGTCISCSDEEIKQTVDYMIAAITGESNKPAVTIPKPKPLSLADGKRIYAENCAVCHDTGFKNAPKPGDKSTWSPIIHQGFVNTFENVVTGQTGHPPRGACPNCTDGELKAAVKYMMQESSTGEDFSLW